MSKPLRPAATSKPQRPIPKVESATRQVVPPPSKSTSAHEVKERRPTYVDAVAVYEQALRTLQQHNYAKAAELLSHVVSKFPEERDLIERSRLYLALCERHLKPPAAEPLDTVERLYAATLALNAGEPDRAIGYLNRVRADEPSNDRALYMLAVAHAERGEPRVAIPYLEQAIEANPENRALARVDPDLEGLRAEHAVTALLDAALSRFGRDKPVVRRRL
jgi:tetratricopeptide (TPR) repeat protein